MYKHKAIIFQNSFPLGACTFEGGVSTYSTLPEKSAPPVLNHSETVVFASSMLLNRTTFRCSSSFGNIEKSDGAISGLYSG